MTLEQATADVGVDRLPSHAETECDLVGGEQLIHGISIDVINVECQGRVR
jgi:hypothetical protein